MAAFAEKVRQARAELGITMEELGKAAGVSGRTIFDEESFQEGSFQEGR